MNKKIERAIRLYPWYWGFGLDLLFFMAIDTLFLVSVKQFSEQQILLLTTISMIVGIAIRFPVLWLVQKIGNTWSIRLGAFCLFLSALLITIGPTFWIIVIGKSFRSVTYVTNDVAAMIALENNLEQVDRSKEYIKYRTNGYVKYSVITLVISMIATTLFNINNYLPMICCVGSAFVAFVLSFFVADYSDKNRLNKKHRQKRERVKIEDFAIWAIVVYGIASMVVGCGVTDAKLFIQQDFLQLVSLETTANIIGAIYFVSRIAKLLANMCFVNLYAKMRLKTGILIVVMLAFAFVLLLSGTAITNFPIKILVMGAGYIFILLCYDPVRHYIQQIFVQHTPTEQHQNLFAYMGLANSICCAFCSAVFSAILLQYTMISVMLIYLTLCSVAVIMMWILYKKLSKEKNTR